MSEADTQLDSDAMEALLAQALGVFEADGAAALAQFLSQHPRAEPRLRQALQDLGRAELLQRPADAPPRDLGEFRIRQRLGEGGMGVVYLAEQTSLGREVALKVVRPELLYFDGARERFRREIDAVARLEHPAIVPILATGIADGIPYYAMPRLRGRSADAVVEALVGRDPASLAGSDLRRTLVDPLDAEASDADRTFAGAYWRAVVHLVQMAAHGIHHAHTRGILHRDLKPSNLMLTTDGRAIVLDFGLAQARGDAAITRPGTAPGSPAYMAPEQVRGEPADERTDVYGLAATMHCLLVLRSPFDADDPELLRRQILAGTRPDLRRSKGLPTELRLVLDTALDVERGRRYATAGAFADDLQAVLDGRPIKARRLPLGVRIWRQAQRHRGLATAAATALAFVVLLPVILLWQQHRANADLAIQVQRANRSVEVSVDAVEKLLTAIGSRRMMHVPAAQDVAAEMARGAIHLFEQLGTDPHEAHHVMVLRIRTHCLLALIESSRGQHDAALDAATRGSELAGDGEVVPEIRLQRAVVRRALAGLWLDAGREQAVESMTRMIRADLDVLAGEPEYSALVATEKAHLHSYAAALATKRGDAATNEGALRQCVAEYRLADDPLAVAGALINLGQFLKRQKRTDEALPVIEEALLLATSPGAPRDGWPVPRRVEASARRELAGLLRQGGRNQAAIEAFQLALQSFDRFLADYPEEPSARCSRGAAANDLALIHFEAREWALARPLLEAACRDQLAVLAQTPDDGIAVRCLVEHRRTLSGCLFQLGDLASLETVARELGRMPGSGLVTLNAARSLLRCAEAATPAGAVTLRAEALDLLVETHRRKQRVTFEDPLYTPLRDEPRFLQIATKTDGG